MHKKSGFKKLTAFIIALVMMMSPLFLTGCFGDNKNNITTQPTQQGGSTGNGGVTGGGNGGNNGSNSSNKDKETRPSIERNDYDNYFKNYRITYQTNIEDRTNFNYQVTEQNIAVSEDIIESLKECYEEDSVFSKIMPMQIPENSGNYLIASIDGNPTAVFFQITEDYFQQYFSHQSAVNLDYEKNKLTIAITLIVQGYKVLDENGAKNAEFDSEYNSQCNALLNGNDIKNEEDFKNFSSQVTHLGFTDRDCEQIENFVKYYIVGENEVKQDDAKFVNCYLDRSSNAIKVEYFAGDARNNSSKFNKYLTDETYATGYLKNNNTEVEFGLPSGFVGADDKALQGLLYYAGYYLASVKSNSSAFETNSLIIESYTGNYSPASNSATITTTYPANTVANEVTRAIYNKLVKTDARESFNANVWKFDSHGNANSDGASSFVVNEAGNVLFSIRLAGFKNYTNTVHKVVKDVLDSSPTEEYISKWQSDLGYEYPYKDEDGQHYINYPNIPYTYFADYDNNDMLFDGLTGAAKMFSGFKCYQNMVLMPQSSVDVEGGAIFVVRQLAENEPYYSDGRTDHSGDFDLTVYVRYYNSEAKNYATWTDPETSELTQYYKLGTKVVEYQEFTGYAVDENGNPVNGKVLNYVPTVFDFSIKDILLSAEVNGTPNTSWTMDAFNDNKDLQLHTEQLVTKENYGECFREDYTPEGNKVIVYDGKAVNSTSYFELVFSCSRNVPFQFCFYPTVAYVPKA